MTRVLVPLFAMALLLVPSTAGALCSHNGELYAKTTLEQEYREANWVVRARVLSATAWSSSDGFGTLYHLEVVDSFKGNLSRRFLFSTERNSGGFYLDIGSEPDLGGEYLLFLVPNPRSAVGSPAVRNSLWVNYECGRSRAWRDVTQAAKNRLAVLSHDG